jgi:hypothetical protein
MLCTLTRCAATHFTKVGPWGRLGRWRKTDVIRHATRYSSVSTNDRDDVMAHITCLECHFNIFYLKIYSNNFFIIFKLKDKKYLKI